MGQVPSEEPEFPPLLDIGMHAMSLDELRQLCVATFPGSVTRGAIMDGLIRIITELERAEVDGELWIDGSYLTEKTDPNDVDLSLKMDRDAYDFGTDAQRAVVDWISQNLRHTHLCDSYVFFDSPTDHPLKWHAVWMNAYWIRQWGFSRNSQIKGFAVIRLTGREKRERAFRFFSAWHRRIIDSEKYVLRISPLLPKM